jgi:ligand-binding sensor domain-containing protein
LANTGLTELDVTGVAVDPSDANRVWAATDGGGVFTSNDGAATWAPTAAAIPEARVNVVAVDPSGVIFAGTRGGMFRSGDLGASWDNISTGLTDLRVLALAIDPRVPTRIFCTTRDGVFRSIDGGGLWQSAITGLGAAGVEDFAFDETAAGVWAASDLGVFHSTDAGDLWTATAPLPDPVTVAVVVASDGTVWVGTEVSGLFTSDDGGASWQAAGAEVTTPLIVHLSSDSGGRLYAGTAHGLFRRTVALVFADGFESGDLSAWSSAVP